MRLTRPQSRAIVSAVCSIATSLGLEVTAEGIESEAQRLALIELGCSAGQGYLFGKPAPARNHTEFGTKEQAA
ncbi:EAL domain-containing protein [Sphingomonas sp. TZW2008]|uniref:EAL domain-containing protein n=1 Tax=Sphingomonas sp. TZW2008 TaxID=1917973 RepID=UPI000A271EE8|nr:EAL domain-containing protein [Sphingomonas sp. TZW2008]